MMAPVFDMDGENYDVDVVSLEREFSIPAAASDGTTLDGTVHRDPVGSYCHYTAVFRAKPGKEEELNALWEQAMQPIIHVCHFPYGSSAINQRMYITGGKQALVRSRLEQVSWGELTLHFIAAEPRSFS